MSQKPFALTELDIAPEQRVLLEHDPALRAMLEARLNCRAQHLQRLSGSKLRRLVWGHLQDIRAIPLAAPVRIPSAQLPAGPLVTDEEVDRKFGSALQRIAQETRATVRAKLRRGLALDRETR
jgi:hypothetical protein